MSRRHTVTILERDFEYLASAVFSETKTEGAAYLLCGGSTTEEETGFLVREVVPVAAGDYSVRESRRLSIDSRSYAGVAKRAETGGCSVFFVHSHPGGIDDFSPQDDREEPKLMEFLTSRLPNRLHGSLVLASRSRLRARVWVAGIWERVDLVRILGARFRFLGTSSDSKSLPEFLDRHVRAFGEDLPRLLRALHVGVVGAGGTGSAVGEQLVRLGIGRLSLFDGDDLEVSNVTRVYGSSTSDVGRNKADVVGAHLKRIGLTDKIEIYPEYILVESVARQLLSCDVVFGCTDKETPRAILVQLALHYLIPVFDLGVKIDSSGGVIRDVTGRVTALVPGEACLLCRGRISPDAIRLESASPEERNRLVCEGYAPQLETREPAVIIFTASVAAQAVMELLHRLTGFMGSDRSSSEMLMRFHETAIRRNRPAPAPTCTCANIANWGKGDTVGPFLGMTWAG